MIPQKEKIKAVTEVVNKLSAPRKKKYEHLFIRTRKLLRSMLRRQHGKKGFKEAWEKYQAENRGKPKTWTEVRITRAMQAGKAKKRGVAKR